MAIFVGTWDNDTISGTAGADTMYGGGGNDVYYVNNAADVINESQIYNDTAIRLVSLATGGALGNGNSGEYTITISGNGNLVGFFSTSDNLLVGDNNLGHEYVIKNMTTGEVTPAITQAGSNAPIASGTGPGAVPAYGNLHITPDGNFVVYSSSSPGIIPAIDSTTDEDIFVKNLVTGDVTIESQPTGSGVSLYHAEETNISDDGRYVVFTHGDNLVNKPDNSPGSDVYWRDRVTGTLKMVSGTFDGSYQGNSGSDDASVTNDGRYVLFESSSTDLVAGDTNNSQDLFVRDMVADTIQLVTASAVTAGATAGNSSYDGQITPDGRYVVFTSRAVDLIAGDTNNDGGVFRKDLTTGEVIRVNTTAAGVLSNAVGYNSQITPDGRYVVFESTARDLVVVSNDSNNGKIKIFVKDLVTGAVEMVSRSAAGLLDTTNSYYAPQISDDGRFIAFSTYNALVSSDTNAKEDVFRIPNPLFSSSDEVQSIISYTLPSGIEILTLQGTAAINGTGNELGNTITGNSGNNSLSGGLGNDILDGGSGIDVAVFSGSRATYALSHSGTQYSVNATSGTEGADTLSNIERLHFSGSKVALDLDGNAGTTAKILGAVFGKTSVAIKEYVGIGLSLLDGGMSYADLMQLALTAKLGAGFSNAAEVNLIYQNLVGVLPSPGELNYWTGTLTSGQFTQASLAVMAADLDLNKTNIDLVGLAQTGIEYA